jgi:hypothetical protein
MTHPVCSVNKPGRPSMLRNIPGLLKRNIDFPAFQVSKTVRGMKLGFLLVTSLFKRFALISSLQTQSQAWLLMTAPRRVPGNIYLWYRIRR